MSSQKDALQERYKETFRPAWSGGARYVTTCSNVLDSYGSSGSRWDDPSFRAGLYFDRFLDTCRHQDRH